MRRAILAVVVAGCSHAPPPEPAATSMSGDSVPQDTIVLVRTAPGGLVQGQPVQSDVMQRSFPLDTVQWDQLVDGDAGHRLTFHCRGERLLAVTLSGETLPTARHVENVGQEMNVTTVVAEPVCRREWAILWRFVGDSVLHHRE